VSARNRKDQPKTARGSFRIPRAVVERVEPRWRLSAESLGGADIVEHRVLGVAAQGFEALCLVSTLANPITAPAWLLVIEVLTGWAV